MSTEDAADELVTSADPLHPANLIPSLCRQFYTLGWVTGTGGGVSIATPTHEFLAPSGVQKERLAPGDLFVAARNPNGSILTNCSTAPSQEPAPPVRADDDPTRGSVYVRTPAHLKPSACTPLFRAAFARGAGACIHTHSQWAVLVTLLLERKGQRVFEIEELEQIKGIRRGRGKQGSLGYFDRLRVPVIENTAREEDLTVTLEAAMEEFPDTYAVLVRRHGVYVWGDDWEKAKTMCESFDYIFQLAVEMAKLGIPWTKEAKS